MRWIYLCSGAPQEALKTSRLKSFPITKKNGGKACFLSPSLRGGTLAVWWLCVGASRSHLCLRTPSKDSLRGSSAPFGIPLPPPAAADRARGDPQPWQRLRGGRGGGHFPPAVGFRAGNSSRRIIKWWFRAQRYTSVYIHGSVHIQTVCTHTHCA